MGRLLSSARQQLQTYEKDRDSNSKCERIILKYSAYSEESSVLKRHAGEQNDTPTDIISLKMSNKRASASSSRSSSGVSDSDGSILLDSLRDSKKDIQQLNDRLAWFIDEVKHLESENARLRSEARRYQRLAEVKAQFERELVDARKILEQTDRRMANLEDKNVQLRERLERKTKDLQDADGDVEYYKNRCRNLESYCKKTQSERSYQVYQLTALLKEAKEDLREEQRQCAKYKTRAQDLCEDLKHKERLHRQEINEIHSRHHSELKKKIEEISEKLAEQYETWLKQALQALRDKHRAQMHANRF
ncbi:hypothetical protein QAD02_012463 [Eretmocerus hayati]|uniref:Uncharacterized protein n=1 Tax=Eretmocerus hayati TaxID=131215 RepID=A0ACC2P1G5_9HYME|nr:hypothetical protein QAD02_012463 [Eretmocerus hayati]